MHIGYRTDLVALSNCRHPLFTATDREANKSLNNINNIMRQSSKV